MENGKWKMENGKYKFDDDIPRLNDSKNHQLYYN
jgi:hypothetical protein